MTPSAIRTEMDALRKLAGFDSLVIVQMHSHTKSGCVSLTVSWLGSPLRPVVVTADEWVPLLAEARRVLHAMRLVETHKMEMGV